LKLVRFLSVSYNGNFSVHQQTEAKPIKQWLKGLLVSQRTSKRTEKRRKIAGILSNEKPGRRGKVYSPPMVTVFSVAPSRLTPPNTLQITGANGAQRNLLPS
jgi:hypothetical protein